MTGAGQVIPAQLIAHDEKNIFCASGQRHSLWPVSAGLDIATIDATGELCGPAGSEDTRLLHPIFPFDPALEVERAAYALDVCRGPIGDLLVGGNLHRIETPLDQDADATDALEVLRRRRTHHPIVRADAMGCFGPWLRVLISLRAHGPQRTKQK